MKKCTHFLRKLIALFVLTGLFATANAQQFIGVRSHAGATVSFGVVTFNADDPGTVETIAPLAITGTGIVAAQFSQGYYYFIVATGANAAGPFTLWKMSVEDWEPVSLNTTFSFAVGETPIAMEKNYTTNEIYLVTNALMTNATNIYSLDTATGAITLLNTVNRYFQVVARNPSGTWYGITIANPIGETTTAGEFRSFGLTDGTTTLIGAASLSGTTIVPQFGQSMTFDRASGNLFWASATGSPRGSATVRLQEIDVTTGELTNLGDIQNRSYIMGLSSTPHPIGFSPANESIDQSITNNLTVTFNNNITATDLTAISISPAVSGVSASVANNVLTIAHDGLSWYTDYTVTVSAEAIQFLEFDVAWTFRTMANPIDCNPPSQLNAENITANTATLSWHENGGATSWIVSFGATGFDVATGGTQLNINTNPFVLTGLTHNTTYDFYVKADCGGNETSAWSPVHTFTTLIDCTVALSVPWSENFSSPIFPEQCWGNFDIDGLPNQHTGEPTMWERIASWGHVQPRTGNAIVWHNFAFQNFAPDSEEGWLVTPKLAIPTGEDVYILRFWSYHDARGNYGPRVTDNPGVDAFNFGRVSVRVSIGSNDPASGDFVEVWTPKLIAGQWIGVAGNDWQEIKVNLSRDFAGQEVYIAFVYEGRFGTRWFLDSMSVDVFDHKELQIASFDRPATGGQNLTNAEPVSVTLSNRGSMPLVNVPITLTINGVQVAREIITEPIPSLTFFEYTFSHKADFSVVGTYVIEIEIELDGNTATENTKVSRTIVSTSGENVRLYGFSIWNTLQPDSRFISFNLNTFNTAVTELQQFTNDDNISVAGEYLNGQFFLFSQNSNTDIRGQFIVFDAETWDEIRRTNVAVCPHEMTFCYSTRTMFAARGTSANRSNLYTVDLITGELTLVGTINGLVLGLASHLNGTLFAALSGGYFVEINKTNGAITPIGNTGFVDARNVQSMAFDHNTGRLFWSLAGNISQVPGGWHIYGGLAEIDYTTGAAHFYGRFGTVHTIVVGLHTPFEDPGTTTGFCRPNEITGITVYPNPVNAGGTLNINLPAGVSNAVVRIYNVHGSLVQQQETIRTITAPNQAGLYVLRITLPDGAGITQRILVK